ncbi:hypothetical protein CARUB_v10022414mg [Capsella rubella]|uniref:non-specific serine/threonine protein kinase n=1 Tax=Capsella rubella TaxID=81985 RepID=R0GG46_9BRAS|nr:hypothetical protein CARUB_v10022414mg [Capsella rubella]
MINMFLSQTNSTSYRIIWILFLFQSCVYSADELHRHCNSPFSCGNQRNLSYPFWIPGREDCGHPDFKLDCNRGFAELSSMKLRILESNYTTRFKRLARVDYINNLCPQNPPNVPFDENVLPFAPDTEMLTLYYNCTGDLSVSTYGTYFDCDDDDTRNYYLARNVSSPLLEESSAVLNDFKKICSRNLSIPASRQALDTLEKSPSTYNLKKAVEEGFEVEVNSDCEMCVSSGGTCGYNQSSGGFICYCRDETHNSTCGSKKKGVVAASAFAVVILIVAGLFWLISYRSKKSDKLRKQNLAALIPLKNYSYAQIQRITKSFAEVVGKGGFGTVYKGTFSDGCSVAVKILKDSKGNGEDFINEVASMSKTSHVNIVSLLGFCSEGSKRAILYEFVENGSLDRFISRNTSMNMEWMKLYNIALGIARGLEYLHHGCKTRIVHFDIKPQNVLLDDNFCPKVSDFGLAKLWEKKESTLSLLNTRGTIGYIAPELFSRMYGRVSHKSDVYSYGMLLLEMIGARNKERAEHISASNTSSMYFPEWIYKDLEKGNAGRLIKNGNKSEEEDVAKKMTLVGLWCIQPSPSDRPAMNRVIEMMEGNLDALEVPPRPVFQIPTVSLQESSSLLEDISVYTEVCSINVA